MAEKVVIKTTFNIRLLIFMVYYLSSVLDICILQKSVEVIERSLLFYFLIVTSLFCFITCFCDQE